MNNFNIFLNLEKFLFMSIHQYVFNDIMKNFNTYHLILNLAISQNHFEVIIPLTDIRIYEWKNIKKKLQRIWTTISKKKARIIKVFSQKSFRFFSAGIWTFWHFMVYHDLLKPFSFNENIISVSKMSNYLSESILKQ